MKYLNKLSLVSFLHFCVNFALLGYSIHGIVIITMVVLQFLGITPFAPPIQLEIPVDTSIISNPQELGLKSFQLNLQSLMGSFIPGFVSYKATAAYLSLVISRLAIISLILYGLGKIKILLKELDNNRPFSKKNVTQLRTLALLVAIITPVQLVFRAISYWYLTTFENLTHVLQWNWQIDYKYLLIGLGLYVISEVFRQGHEMYQELKLTV
jgi:hypothetical protein